MEQLNLFHDVAFNEINHKNLMQSKSGHAIEIKPIKMGKPKITSLDREYMKSTKRLIASMEKGLVVLLKRPTKNEIEIERTKKYIAFWEGRLEAEKSRRLGNSF